MYSVHQERSYRLVSVRSVSLSVTRSHRVTLSSVPESLSRWNLSSSASREPIWNGSSIGEASAATGYFLLVWKKKNYVCVIMIRQNLHSILRERQISNSYSHLDGANSGESQIVPIMIWHSIRTHPVRIWHTLMIQRVSVMCHMLSSLLLVQTVCF